MYHVGLADIFTDPLLSPLVFGRNQLYFRFNLDSLFIWILL